MYQQPSTPSPQSPVQDDSSQVASNVVENEVEDFAQQSASNADDAVSVDSKESTEGDPQKVEAEAEVLEQEVSEDEPALDADDMVAQAQAEAREWQDKFMRLHAEWDTYRRRTAEAREAEKVRATEKLVNELIPVIDDFERTIDYADKNAEAGLIDGVKAVHDKFVGVLTRGGVEVINPVGEAFDSLEAQAVATVDDPSVCDETVNEVYQKGYKMGTKVLRPAMVTVAVGGPKREQEDPSA